MDSYYAIGFDFNRGSFRCVDISQRGVFIPELGNAKRKSSSYLFSKVGFPVFFFDFKESMEKSPAMKKYLSRPVFYRDVGAMHIYRFRRIYYNFQSFITSYDALIFIEQTTCSKPIIKE